jgi:NAD(P)-dependent dehydrogenase (short-subunit alcohol dehydrogenase family)
VQRFEAVNALVTGASSGIGFAAAQRLASEGACVLAVARDEAKLQAAIAQWPHPERHVALAFDASDEAAVEKGFARIREFQMPVSVAVCAAGMHMMRPLNLMKRGHFDQVLAANVQSALLCSKAVAKQIPANGGSIVWLASAAGLVGNFGESAYAAAKGALIAACRSVATELAPKRVRVNCVAPAVVKTPMSEAWLKQLTPDQSAGVEKRHLLGLGEPDDVAGAIAFLASPDARWITGTCVAVDGGFTCH